MSNYEVNDNVTLGTNCQIGNYVVIGEVPKKLKNLETLIGNNALIRSHSVIYAGNKIGNNFQTGHYVLIRENNNIGNNVCVGSYSHIAFDVIIRDNVRIHTGAYVFEKSYLKEGAWLGPGVMLTNTKHPLCQKAKECMRGPIIGKNAKICAGAIILPDIEIGEMALIGAGSVVTKDVPAREVWHGNPAKRMSNIDELKCAYDLIDKPY